jgi:hypothetical protein
MPREPFKTTLDSAVINKIKHIAIEEKTDVSKIIEKLLIQYINEHEKKPADK